MEEQVGASYGAQWAFQVAINMLNEMVQRNPSVNAGMLQLQAVRDGLQMVKESYL